MKTNNLVKGQSHFLKKTSTTTLKSPNGRKKNKIENIMVNKILKSTLQDVRAMTKVNDN